MEARQNKDLRRTSCAAQDIASGDFSNHNSLCRLAGASRVPGPDGARASVEARYARLGDKKSPGHGRPWVKNGRRAGRLR